MDKFLEKCTLQKQTQKNYILKKKWKHLNNFISLLKIKFVI